MEYTRFSSLLMISRYLLVTFVIEIPDAVCRPNDVLSSAWNTRANVRVLPATTGLHATDAT